MKRDELKKLLGDGATDETIDAIMGMNGKDIESHKTKATELQGQLDAANGQLTEAGKQIESFKNMKPEELQKAADEWKTKFEQAQKDADAKIAAMQYDHELDGALAGVKAKNAKAVKALLDHDQLKDANGKFIAERFNEQLGKIKPENDYLFESDKPTPKIVAGGNSKPILTDAVALAARKAANLPVEE